MDKETRKTELIELKSKYKSFMWLIDVPYEYNNMQGDEKKATENAIIRHLLHVFDDIKHCIT
jgi:hypothetical protein